MAGNAMLVYASAATVHVVEAGFRRIFSWAFAEGVRHG